MNNQLLIFPDNKEHYFFVPNKGICTRHKDKCGMWTNAETVIADAMGPFCVYADSPTTTHLIYVTSDSNLSYAIRRNGIWKAHTLSSLNPKIKPKVFCIYPVNDRLNLIYSVKYSDEILLIHCILGNHAKPQAVNKLSSSHFWICNNKAYYTDAGGNCGYTDLADEKPDSFIKLYDNARNISVYNTNNKEITLFTRDNKLYINNTEIIYDTRMEMPILTQSEGVLYVLWKSGGYVRYIFSVNEGETWSSPMRYMASGAEIKLYSCQLFGNSHLFYGYNTACDLHLFSKPDIFKL